MLAHQEARRIDQQPMINHSFEQDMHRRALLTEEWYLLGARCLLRQIHREHTSPSSHPKTKHLLIFAGLFASILQHSSNTNPNPKHTPFHRSTESQTLGMADMVRNKENAKTTSKRTKKPKVHFYRPQDSSKTTQNIDIESNTMIVFAKDLAKVHAKAAKWEVDDIDSSVWGMNDME